MFISKKRLEKIVNDRTVEEKWKKEIELQIERIEDTLRKQRRRIEMVDDCQYKRMDVQQMQIKDLREMLLKSCGKQPPENAEKE